MDWPFIYIIIITLLMMILFPQQWHLSSYSSHILVDASRVIEMNDRLVDVYPNDKRSFLIKFYAPWCHHCQELEPIWAQVAQQLHNLDANIVVGRVDCTKYLTAASHFTIKGFPTILYINSQKQIEFKGDRNRDDIIDFALRVHGPPIRYLSSCEQLNDLVRSEGHRVIFINFGPEADSNFSSLAATFQPFDWFFRSLILCKDFQPGIYALKSNNINAKFDYQQHGDLASWIGRHRFPHFTRFSASNLQMALNSHKLLVITIVEEHRSSGKLVGQKNVASKALMESIAYTFNDPEDHFLFGYCSDLVTMNSLAIRTIDPIPNLLILNSSNLKYLLYSDHFENNDHFELTTQNVILFLNDVINQADYLMYRGGDTYLHQLIRMCFDTISTIITMYHGNPILTLLLFGLPGSFFAMIIYMTCCSDFLDQQNDDDVLIDSDIIDEHEKRD